MPRASRIRCPYAEPPKPVTKPKKPKVVLTPEEKEIKKQAALERKAEKEKKKTWEDSLKEWRGQDPHRGTLLPDGTECLFKSDAKKYYKLSDKDLAALPFYHFAASSKSIYPLAPIVAHVKRRFEATGIEYPSIKPAYTISSSRHVKHLGMKSNYLENMIATGAIKPHNAKGEQSGTIS